MTWDEVAHSFILVESGPSGETIYPAVYNQLKNTKNANTVNLEIQIQAVRGDYLPSRLQPIQKYKKTQTKSTMKYKNHSQGRIYIQPFTTNLEIQYKLEV